jgi:hypothetical protein
LFLFIFLLAPRDGHKTLKFIGVLLDKNEADKKYSPKYPRLLWASNNLKRGGKGGFVAEQHFCPEEPRKGTRRDAGRNGARVGGD